MNNFHLFDIFPMNLQNVEDEGLGLAAKALFYFSKHCVRKKYSSKLMIHVQVHTLIFDLTSVSLTCPLVSVLPVEIRKNIYKLKKFYVYIAEKCIWLF